jgi:hypothetical protein
MSAKILPVEDEPPIRPGSMRLVEGAGHDVIEAADIMPGRN